jgi:ABC-type proline/glycine betaine transport system permease subunit
MQIRFILYNVSKIDQIALFLSVGKLVVFLARFRNEVVLSFLLIVAMCDARPAVITITLVAYAMLVSMLGIPLGFFLYVFSTRTWVVSCLHAPWNWRHLARCHTLEAWTLQTVQGLFNVKVPQHQDKHR